MKLKVSLVLAALALSVASLAAFASTSNAAPPARGSISAPVNTTTTSGAPVVGTLNVTGFRLVNGVLNAVGTFTGTVGGQQVTQDFTAPVAPQQAAGSCQVLDLVLGPLHLDVLGLVVDLNQVHLNITAEQRPGNLLGN